MRKIIEELRLIWIEATHIRKYNIGKYQILVKPFSITIKKH
tara:strand:+ start:378 stop:500 length:123 start_codon:yes stop_codon:yes gene_type:complete